MAHEQSANSIEEDGWIFALDQEHEELCELIMIDSGASVHVCPPDHDQENRLRTSSKTRPLLTASRAEMKQHGMRQASYDTEFGKITTDCRVLDVRRPIWSLGSIMDSGCDVHFTKNRCWISQDDGKDLDMIRSGGVFFVAARPSRLSSREASSLELNPVTAAEVEQAALAREHAAFGTPGPATGATLDGDGEPAVRVKVPTGPATPSAEERALHEPSRHVPHRSWCQWCIAARAANKPHLREQQPDTEEAVPRIEFDFADLGREEDQVLPTPSLNAVNVGSESLSATLCPTKAFSEYLLETMLAFVQALGHNVVMLHSDQEPVLVQLLKAVQSRRVKRTLVRHGPSASHQSQGKIENAHRVINGVCRAMWLSLENLLREKLPSDSILLAWLIRHAALCLTRFQVKNDGRIAFVRVFGKAYTSQKLPFGERVMYKYTSVPTGNQDQRWGHGIWVGKAPMTDEHIILTESGVQKARSLHRVPPEERFVISEFKKVQGLPWGRAENLKATIVTQQDQGPSGHRRVYLTTKVVARHGSTPGCSGCVGLGPHTEACRVQLEKALADERADPVGKPVGPITEPTSESQESAPAA